MNTRNRLRLKDRIYRLCKALGLFHLARFLTRRGLRILCYHGFAIADENQFRPGLFMDVNLFESRMRYLKQHNYPVLSLQEAYRLLQERRLPKDAVVITIDDGFYSTLALAQPILSKYSFPATVYVTSYYSRKETPIFRLVLQYVSWKADSKAIGLGGLGLPPSLQSVPADNTDRDRVLWEVIRFGESQLDDPGRCRLAAELARRAGLDYQRIAQGRIMNLMNPTEIAKIARSGIDVQLHTHRHQLPEDKDLAQREIVDNRNYLEPIAEKKLSHLCYPSGIWSREHWPWLDDLAIQTATTCDVGLNYPDTPRFGLKRFLDGDNISPIEFEAEVSGFSELLRRGRSYLAVASSRQPNGTAGAASRHRTHAE